MSAIQSQSNPLTQAEQNSIFKLLLNSWSAEYALRIKPLDSPSNDDFIQSSQSWMFPQGYYAAYMSLRAVLLTFGRNPINLDFVQACGEVLYTQGFYFGVDLPSDFYRQLSELRLFDGNPQPLSVEQILDKQTELTQLIDRVQFIHEHHILETIGMEAYAGLINQLPSYLQDAFVADRLARIIAREVVGA